MDQTAIQPEIADLKPAGLNGQAGVNGAAPVSSAKVTKAMKHPARIVLERLADLRITVTLFALALVLVFWGTLAQVDNGVWTVVRSYFRCFYVLVPLKVVFFNMIEETAIKVPYPGGFLIGSVMMVNLLAAHAIRFKLTWNRSGILLIHAGIIIMMTGEIVTHLYAEEGSIRMSVGQSSNKVMDIRSSELAIIEEVDAKTDDLVVVPARLLKDGATVNDPKVPFKIEVIQFMVNSNLRDVPDNHQANKGFGRAHVADPQPEVNGLESAVDLPSAYLKLFSRDGKELGVWLVSARFVDPQWQWIEVGNKKYKVALRFKETLRDFTMHLTKFDHKVFGGTSTPKDYRSYVHLVDKPQNVERDVEIYMNAPLYYRGETFYQSGMDKDERTGVITTTLSVVRNPGWLLPYVSCAVVGFGLLIHFGLTLYRFLDRRVVR